MEEDNVKKIKLIIIVSLIIILIIILLSLKDVFFKYDTYGYEKLSTKSTTKYIPKTTKKIIDDSFKDLSSDEAIKYNSEYNDRKYLIPFNDLLKDNISKDYYDLIGSKESRFIYSYISLKLKGKSELSNDDIKSEMKSIFNEMVEDEYYKKYLKDDYYEYSYDDNYSYCLKFKKIKEDNNKIYLNLDIIDYDIDKCDAKNMEYDSVREGLLTLLKVDDKYYLNSFTLLEGRKK